jgi:hypothetical protein
MQTLKLLAVQTCGTLAAIAVPEFDENAVGARSAFEP